MFDKFHITFASAVTAAALGMFVLPVALSPASASICTDSITTLWTPIDDTSTTTNETGFTACSTSSTLAGDGVLTSDPDPYSVSVFAIDDDTFQLTGTISDIGPTGIGDSPTITLVLSDIDWVGMSGSIDDVIATVGAFFSTPGAFGSFNVTSFTTDTITINGNFGCTDLACSVSGVDLGTYDLVATHVVPLPAALPLFLSALAGLGFVGWRRTKVAA